VRSRAAARAALLLASSAAALAAAGCGSGRHATPEGPRVQREDLIAAAHALSEGQPSIDAEVAATKAVWPSILKGLPANVSSLPGSRIERAEREAAALKLPTLFTETNAQGLTGPASGMAGLYRSSMTLAMRGWRMIGYCISQIREGSPSAARFARSTSNLYIESVYDANFGLAQLGKKLTKGYEQLEGPEGAFGDTLTEAQVKALASAYSEPRYRLYPHVGVKFGT
jgi:phage tail protein X